MSTFNSYCWTKLPLTSCRWPLGTLWKLLISASFGFWRVIHFDLTGEHVILRTPTRSQVRAVCHLRLYLLVWIPFLLPQIFSISTQWSEGCAVNMDSVRVAAPPWFPAAKEHVEELQLASGHTQTNYKQCIRKRSYKRAIRRAELHGFTLYRGCLRTATQLGTVYKGTFQHAPQKPNVTQTQKLKRKRITCFNWNCSGLSPSGWDFIQQWLTCQRLDVIMLQETHWRHTSEWLTEHYYAMHSGLDDGRAGLLTLINKDLCTTHDLSWREISPGRIMHVRVHGRDRDLDFVNVYQHVHARDRMDARLQFWTDLQTLLSTFPQRNPLTILGDWNTTLRRTSTAVGLDTYMWRQTRCGGPKHADSHIFQNILQQFDLVSVNTWHAQSWPNIHFRGTNIQKLTLQYADDVTQMPLRSRSNISVTFLWFANLEHIMYPNLYHCWRCGIPTMPTPPRLDSEHKGSNYIDNGHKIPGRQRPFNKTSRPRLPIFHWMESTGTCASSIELLSCSKGSQEVCGDLQIWSYAFSAFSGAQPTSSRPTTADIEQSLQGLVSHSSQTTSS